MEGLSHVFIFGLLVVGSAAKTTHHFYYGTATWYGAPNGDGTDGGACGYGATVYENGYRTREAAVSDVLFMKGQGCGQCYKVMCYDPYLCKKKPVTVVVMDQSPGGLDPHLPHFDLSGSAFGRLAVDGQADNLRNVGGIQIVWARTPCKYGKKNITFHVMTGSTGYWLSLLVEFENGDGDIKFMQIKEASSSDWYYMDYVWGASWSAHPRDYRNPLQGPFSINITSSTGKSLVFSNVIPSDWKPGASYTSQINF